MALNTSALQVAAAAIDTDITHMTLHSAQPDASGSNRTTAGVQAVDPTSSGGVVSIASTAFTGGASGGACTHAGFWAGDPDASGVFRGWLALSGDQTFNASGAYTVSSVTLTGSAS